MGRTVKSNIVTNVISFESKHIFCILGLMKMCAYYIMISLCF